MSSQICLHSLVPYCIYGMPHAWIVFQAVPIHCTAFVHKPGFTAFVYKPGLYSMITITCIDYKYCRQHCGS